MACPRWIALKGAHHDNVSRPELLIKERDRSRHNLWRSNMRLFQITTAIVFLAIVIAILGVTVINA